ncbi:phosphatidylglycerophosphatase A [bacterium]|nr:MAG: phosphatidylglycerophosphatase A [bacterium]
MKLLVKLIASGFGAGYVPIAPGTVGSLWGVAIYVLLYRYPSVFVLSTLILFYIGFAVSSRAEKLFGEKDSKKIVIDEIASMCMVFMFIKPDWLILLTGFLLFRFFDIVKPPPARMVEKYSGAKAVMLDDVIAAAYTIMVLFALSSFQKAGILPVMNIQGLAG